MARKNLLQKKPRNYGFTKNVKLYPVNYKLLIAYTAYSSIHQDMQQSTIMSGLPLPTGLTPFSKEGEECNLRNVLSWSFTNFEHPQREFKFMECSDDDVKRQLIRKVDAEAFEKSYHDYLKRRGHTPLTNTGQLRKSAPGCQNQTEYYNSFLFKFFCTALGLDWKEYGKSTLID